MGGGGKSKFSSNFTKKALIEKPVLSITMLRNFIPLYGHFTKSSYLVLFLRKSYEHFDSKTFQVISRCKVIPSRTGVKFENRTQCLHLRFEVHTWSLDM